MVPQWPSSRGLMCPPLERLLQQRVVVEIDLADRQVIGRPPVGVHLAQFVGGQGICLGSHHCLLVYAAERPQPAALFLSEARATAGRGRVVAELRVMRRHDRRGLARRPSLSSRVIVVMARPSVRTS